jgi:hypothetical protein
MTDKPPPEDPTHDMIDAGVRMHRTPRGGPDETLVHDIWQAMYDAWLASSDAAIREDCCKMEEQVAVQIIICRDEAGREWYKVSVQAPYDAYLREHRAYGDFAAGLIEACETYISLTDNV